MQNPYEIGNIREAYKRVVSKMNDSTIVIGITGKGNNALSKIREEEIEPNYIYVRFDPKDYKQELDLKKEWKILVIDYPFEYENSEDYYNSVTMKEEEILSYWASIPITKRLPKNIPYTILEEMYIPEKDPKYNTDDSGNATQKGVVNDEFDFMNHLIEEAYIATNNEDLLPPTSEKIKEESCETCFLGINLKAKWTPSGNLQIWDDHIGNTTTSEKVFSHYEYYDCEGDDAVKKSALTNKPGSNNDQCQHAVYTYTNVTVPGSYIPLEGANVLVRDTWTLDSAITDSNGDYVFKKLRAKVKYIIQWDRYQFSIRDHSGFFQAEDKGPKLYNQAWNHKIKGGREEYRGHIFQAALDYYYHDIGGLTRPPTNGFWQQQIKIAAIQVTNGVSSTKMAVGSDTFGIVPHIKIKKYHKETEKVYGTTIHELAHAAHYHIDAISYSDIVEQAYILNLGNANPGPIGASSRRLLESWATGVEIFLTKKRYKKLGQETYRYKGFDLQDQKIDIGSDERFYTTTFFDLADTENQRETPGQGIAYPMDNVQNVSWINIEKSLIGSRNWEQCKANNISISGQATNINALFNNW